MVRGIMEVSLVDARGLGDTDFIGRMDPYVLIQYRNQERKTEAAQGEGGCPVWNEKHSFSVSYPGIVNEYKLVLRIMDRDTFSADDFIGEAVIYVKDLLSLGAEKGSMMEMHPRKHCVVRADATYCGDIRVGVTFTPKAEDEMDEEIGGWKEDS